MDARDRSLQIWQGRTTRRLAPGDACQIVSNLSDFLSILSEWDAKDRSHDGMRDAPEEARREG